MDQDVSRSRGSAGWRGIRAVTVEARGEAFKIVQLAGMLFVCTRQHGSCCCGWDEKGRMPFDPSLWGDERERRKIRNRLHLTFTGCLGPCAVGNNALLQLHGRSIWLKDLNDARLIPAVFDYAEAMLAAGRALPPPDELRAHVYERSVPPQDSANGVDVAPPASPEEAGADLAGLDPVCLMEADPTTSRHVVEYGGRTIAFCAPACKKEFLADPAAYVGA